MLIPFDTDNGLVRINPVYVVAVRATPDGGAPRTIITMVTDERIYVTAAPGSVSEKICAGMP